MRYGQRFTVTGTLRWTKLGYALELDRGGMWQLEIGWTCMASAKVNRRVTVEGVRTGFNELVVKKLRIVE